ncbi:MAG: MBL fold metallo-hydrolase [Cyclobacteriaceae bacterium]
MVFRKSYIKHKKVREVNLYRVGVSYLGKPIKPVHFFEVDGLLIDTGPSLAEAAVSRLVTQLDISQIILTHTHEDHSGNAAALKQLLGVPVYGHILSMEIMMKGFDILPYQKAMFGPAEQVTLRPVDRKIDTEKYSFEIIHTPGHAPEHIALYERNQGWLFSGDLFVAEKIKYFRKHESMTEQIKSLKKLARLDFDFLFCNHNPQLKDGKAKLIRKLHYFEELYGHIKDQHKKGLNTDEIMKALKIQKSRPIELLTYKDVSARYLVTSVTRELQ